ncbi:APC family permease [Metallosphaera hakonensis]|uniref:Amino acid permease n=1 Tax=Metallosphaera hakonensis JCM 8857 = DSM 7519 TaxID=1293036 RepID=A0A2U9IT99_9CREN|nr:APC family permease [Metallosphaera hakonensis]AWR99254.1 amino acid permease [Metallosphaera hakonensis JCM 8857 = DSM 7519]
MRLGRGVISLKETYGQAMAVTAPLGSVVSTSTAAILYAGHSVVFTTLLALLGSALWIYSLTSYTKRVASPGGYYTFGYSAWRRKIISFFEALTEVFAYSLLNAVNAITLYLLVSIGFQVAGIATPWWLEPLIIALGLAYPTLISLTDIKKLLGYVVTISATAEVILLLGLFALSLTKPFHPEYFTPAGVSSSDIAQAFVLSMVSISGAGAATYLGEEAKKPLKTITQGMWLSLLIGGIAMFLGTYALVALWSGSLSSLANSPQPLIYEMFQYGRIPMFIALVLAANSLLASNIGTTLGSARILFNLSREKAAPLFLSKTTKSGEPLIATMMIGGLSTLVVIFSIFGLGVATAFADVSVITGIFWLTGRIIDGFGVPVFYYRIGQLSWNTLLIPLAATGINVWGVSQSLPLPDMFSMYAIVAILLIIGVWYALIGRKGKPGSLVVDENNQVITIEEYMERLKKKVPM